MVSRRWFDWERAGLFFLFVLAAAIRGFFLFKYDNMPGIAETNIQWALRILSNPDLLRNFDGNTSMLYRYAIALVMYFWRDPIWAPKVLTSLFGALLVLPYYGTLKILFGRGVAFFSSLTLVFYTMHVLQSNVTCSHAVFYFFLFSAFYYFFSFGSAQGQKAALWVSALLFNVAALLRFESWIFIPVFFFLLWPKGKKTAFLFLGLSMVFPCLHLILNKMVQHEFLWTFVIPVRVCRWVIEYGGAGIANDQRLWAWAVVLWRQCGLGLVAGGGAGMAFAFLFRRGFELALFFLALFLELTFNTSLGRLLIDERYGISLALLLIPYAWFFVDRVLAFAGERRSLFFVLFFIFPAMTFWRTIQDSASLAAVQAFLIPPGVRETGLWLKKNVLPKETIIIGDDLFPVNLLLRSGISEARCMIEFPPIPMREAAFNSKGEIESYLSAHRPRYVVLASNSYLQKVLEFDLEQRQLVFGNTFLEVVFEQELTGFNMRYLIYRVSYEG